jgi:hypothetical protein
MDFLHQFFTSFTATHVVALAGMACVRYVAKTVGVHFGKRVIQLNENLERLNSTILKVDILWERSADVSMFRELDTRERRPAAKAHGA